MLRRQGAVNVRPVYRAQGVRGVLPSDLLLRLRLRAGAAEALALLSLRLRVDAVLVAAGALRLVGAAGLLPLRARGVVARSSPLGRLAARAPSPAVVLPARPALPRPAELALPRDAREEAAGVAAVSADRARREAGARASVAVAEGSAWRLRRGRDVVLLSRLLLRPRRPAPASLPMSSWRA